MHAQFGLNKQCYCPFPESFAFQFLSKLITNNLCIFGAQFECQNKYLMADFGGGLYCCVF